MGMVTKNKESLLSKKDKAILYIAIFLPLIFIGLAIFINSWGGKSKVDLYYESRQDEYFHGVIDSIYRQKDNHNIMTISSRQSVFEIAGEWEEKFRLGDSIVKDKGSLVIEIFRNGTLTESLDYRDLNKEEYLYP